MQTELNLGFKPLTKEQLYWRQVNALPNKGMTNIQQRSRMIIEAYVKHDKLKNDKTKFK